MHTEPLKAYIESDLEKRLSPLMEFLRFPSTADDFKSCRRCASWLCGYIGKLGFDSRLVDTDGKPCVFGSLTVDPDLPTLLIYGHYDVQPPHPLDQWDSDPFEPVIREQSIYARGADDDKGQIFSHLLAVEALIAVRGGLPVNLKLIFEGEEESGSPNMEAFITANRELLSADALVVSDGTFFSDSRPSILSGLRGLCTFEVICRGPSMDLHSGLAGGVVANPINALCRLVGLMHDENGKVTLPGFYDDVEIPSESDIETWNRLDAGSESQAESFGVDVLAGGEDARGFLERLWSRPTLDCNGIEGGFQGNGDKTIIPASASVKISTRLVPFQKPEKIFDAMNTFVEENTPPGIKSEVVCRAAVRPVLLDTGSRIAGKAVAAIEEAFGTRPVFVRCGASIPITEMFQRIMGLDAVMIGIGLPGDNIHAPNEHIPIFQVTRGAVMSSVFMEMLRVDNGA